MHAKVCSGINGGDKQMRDERAVERERDVRQCCYYQKKYLLKPHMTVACTYSSSVGPSLEQHANTCTYSGL